MFHRETTHTKDAHNLFLLEYIIYYEVLTISLNFLLNWYLDIISEVSITRGNRFKSQSPLFKMKYLTPYIIKACVACLHPHSYSVSLLMAHGASRPVPPIRDYAELSYEVFMDGRVYLADYQIISKIF